MTSLHGENKEILEVRMGKTRAKTVMVSLSPAHFDEFVQLCTTEGHTMSGLARIFIIDGINKKFREYSVETEEPDI